MSKRKQPAVFVPPKEWTWYALTSYWNHVLLPFKPTLVEFWWAIDEAPLPPLGERFWNKNREKIDMYAGKRIMKARGYDDMDPARMYEAAHTERILSYARIRHLHPITLPAVMDFTHFI
jgi:hypothetical protein